MKPLMFAADAVLSRSGRILGSMPFLHPIFEQTFRQTAAGRVANIYQSAE
jgi:hypothetical protein